MDGSLLTPQIECVEEFVEQHRDTNNHYGKFVIGPVKIGEGATVGNTLRRALLSSLTGVAITKVEIPSLPNAHEYRSIPGMNEPIFDLLLNLKEVTLRETAKSEDPFLSEKKAIIKIQKSGILTAKSIELPPGLEIVDPDQYIATFNSDKIDLVFELTIERGRGSLLLLDPKRDKAGLIVEAHFMPVKKFHYVVEDCVIHGLQREKILVECWTNGSIGPLESIQKGLQETVELFQALLLEEEEPDLVIIPPPSAPNDQGYRPKSAETLKTKVQNRLIEDLGLSVRSYNCLKAAQIHTIADLLDYSRDDLLELKNFGKKSAEEVTQALYNELGFELPT